MCKTKAGGWCRNVKMYTWGKPHSVVYVAPINGAPGGAAGTVCSATTATAVAAARSALG